MPLLPDGLLGLGIHLSLVVSPPPHTPTQSRPGAASSTTTTTSSPTSHLLAPMNLQKHLLLPNQLLPPCNMYLLMSFLGLHERRIICCDILGGLEAGTLTWESPGTPEHCAALLLSSPLSLTPKICFFLTQGEDQGAFLPCTALAGLCLPAPVASVHA